MLLLRMCADPACSILLASAPVSVQYTVTAATGASAPQVALSTNSVTQNALSADTTGPVVTHAVDLTFTNFNVPPHLGATAVSTNGIAEVTWAIESATQGRVSVRFKAPNQLAAGTHNDTVRIEVCLDPTCVNPAAGSPFIVPVQYVLSDSTTVAGPNGYTLRVLPIQTNDIAWDAASSRLFLSVPSGAPSNADSIVSLDPATGTLSPGTTVGGTPSVLAVSDDGQYLYTGLTGQNLVKRLNLPALTPSLDIPLGVNAQYAATDIAVAPSQGNLIAVALNRSAVALYDDATRRTNNFPRGGGFNSLQWSSTPGEIYISSPDLVWPDLEGLFEVSVDASGVAANRQVWGSAFGFDYRYGGGLLYVLGGTVVDPVSASVLGTLPLPAALPGEGPASMGRVLPSPDVNKSFAYLMLYSGAHEIRSYAIPQRTPIASAVLPGYVGHVRRFLRWGADGLAFNTSEGYVVLIRGEFVAP
jgi:hypothetical protein